MKNVAEPGREPLKVLIIGAGTGGLALAHALKGAGIAFSVYERHQNQFEDQGGYRVGISPAGSRALKSCVPPRLFDLFEKDGERSMAVEIVMQPGEKSFTDAELKAVADKVVAAAGKLGATLRG